jgi:hypothetical protein
LLGTRSTDRLGIWEGLGTVWNSGANTTVTLALFNANLVRQGNDFAVDDIFLGTETTLPVPEPATWSLLWLGILRLGAAHRRQRGVSQCKSLLEETERI